MEPAPASIACLPWKVQIVMPRNVLIGLVSFGSLGPAVCASPMLVQAIGHLGPVSVPDMEPLNDPSQILDMYIPKSAVPASSGSGGYEWPNVDSTIDLLVSVSAPTDLPSWERNWVEVTGMMSGFSATGELSGIMTSARLELAPGATSADIPPYLADLLDHPERIRYSGLDTGQSVSPYGQPYAIIQSSLWIEPPVDPNAVVPTPEPSMLVIALTILAGLLAARRLHAGRR